MSLEKVNDELWMAVDPKTSIEDGLKALDFCHRVGVDVNKERRNYAMTALMEASKHSKVEIVKKLIEMGANINQTDMCGWSPLMYAARYGSVEMLKILIEFGANVNHQCNGRSTALIECTKYTGSADEVKDKLQILINAKANINHQDDRGYTALMNLDNIHEEAARILLSSGANFSLKTNYKKKTALQLAYKNGRWRIAELLINAEKEAAKASKSSSVPCEILSAKAKLPHDVTFEDNIFASENIILEGTLVDNKPSKGTLTFKADTKVNVTVIDGKYVVEF